MIITRGYGSKLVITRGYGFKQKIVPVKREDIGGGAGGFSREDMEIFAVIMVIEDQEWQGH